MSQATTTYRKVPTGSVTLRVPKLIGSKWVYEYPVSASTPKSSINSNLNSRNFRIMYGTPHGGGQHDQGSRPPNGYDLTFKGLQNKGENNCFLNVVI